MLDPNDVDPPVLDPNTAGGALGAVLGLVAAKCEAPQLAVLAVAAGAAMVIHHLTALHPAMERRAGAVLAAGATVATYLAVTNLGAGS